MSEEDSHEYVDMDEKWKQVKDFYERNYKGIIFVSRPNPKKIEFLYQNMKMLLRSWEIHVERARPSLLYLARSRKESG